MIEDKEDKEMQEAVAKLDAAIALWTTRAKTISEAIFKEPTSDYTRHVKLQRDIGKISNVIMLLNAAKESTQRAINDSKPLYGIYRTYISPDGEKLHS